MTARSPIRRSSPPTRAGGGGPRGGPLRSRRFPPAIAQRLDVLIDLPGNGPCPIFAQVEGKRARTGIILAAPGAPVSRLPPAAGENAPPVDLSLERRLE